MPASYSYDIAQVYTPYRALRPSGQHPNPSHWNKVRQQAFERDGFQCRNCPAKLNDVCNVFGKIRLEAHHRHYENWGREQLNDLTTLCSVCHQKHTDGRMAERHKGRDLILTKSAPTIAESCPKAVERKYELPIVRSVFVESTPTSNNFSH